MVILQRRYNGRKLLAASHRVGVVGSQAGLTDGQGAVEQEAGSGQVAVGTQDFAEVVQAAGSVRVLRTTTGLEDGPAQQLFCDTGPASKVLQGMTAGAGQDRRTRGRF
jgi:hypothetical protein